MKNKDNDSESYDSEEKKKFLSKKQNFQVSKIYIYKFYILYKKIEIRFRSLRKNQTKI